MVGGLLIVVLELNYSAIVNIRDVRFLNNTVHSSDSQGNDLISIQDAVGRGGMVFIGFQNVYFGYGISASGVATYSADVYSVRQVELWKCAFEDKVPLSGSITLQTFSVHINPATSAFRIIFRNVTFIHTLIQVLMLSNVTFINSTFRDSSTYSSLSAISNEVGFQGNIVLKNNTGYNGGALALFSGSKMILLPQTEMLFIGNHVTHTGGALMVYNEALIYNNFCFYRIDSTSQIIGVRLIFESNTAEYAGDAIFGGSIQDCKRLHVEFDDENRSTIQHWSQQVQSFSSLFDIRQDGLSVISSQPYRACLCENDMPNCSRINLTKSLYPGDTIAVSAVVVGQMNGTVPGVVHAEFVVSRQSPLSSFQTLQGTERTTSISQPKSRDYVSYTCIHPGIGRGTTHFHSTSFLSSRVRPW